MAKMVVQSQFLVESLGAEGARIFLAPFGLGPGPLGRGWLGAQMSSPPPRGGGGWARFWAGWTKKWAGWLAPPPRGGVDEDLNSGLLVMVE